MMCTESQVGLEVPLNSGSPPSPIPTGKRCFQGRLGDFITLIKGGGEGRIAIGKGLSEVWSNSVSKTQK
jgi:hypothetical protein